MSFALIGGHTLFTDPVGTSQAVQLVATYRGPGGQVRSAPFTVNVLPDMALSADATVVLSAVNGPIYTLTASASASGGTPPYTFNWDADFDNYFDDFNGPSTTFPIITLGTTQRVRVEVVDSLGKKSGDFPAGVPGQTSRGKRAARA